jgi:hypothetical protein
VVVELEAESEVLADPHHDLEVVEIELVAP